MKSDLTSKDTSLWSSGICTVLIYNKSLNEWSLGKLVSFVFPRVLRFPSTSSRETSGLSAKQN